MRRWEQDHRPQSKPNYGYSGVYNGPDPRFLEYHQNKTKFGGLSESGNMVSQAHLRQHFQQSQDVHDISQCQSHLQPQPINHHHQRRGGVNPVRWNPPQKLNQQFKKKSFQSPQKPSQLSKKKSFQSPHNPRQQFKNESFQPHSKHESIPSLLDFPLLQSPRELHRCPSLTSEETPSRPRFQEEQKSIPSLMDTLVTYPHGKQQKSSTYFKNSVSQHEWQQESIPTSVTDHMSECASSEHAAPGVCLSSVVSSNMSKQIADNTEKPVGQTPGVQDEQRPVVLQVQGATSDDPVGHTTQGGVAENSVQKVAAPIQPSPVHPESSTVVNMVDTVACVVEPSPIRPCATLDAQRESASCANLRKRQRSHSGDLDTSLKTCKKQPCLTKPEGCNTVGESHYAQQDQRNMDRGQDSWTESPNGQLEQNTRQDVAADNQSSSVPGSRRCSHSDTGSSLTLLGTARGTLGTSDSIQADEMMASEGKQPVTSSDNNNPQMAAPAKNSTNTDHIMGILHNSMYSDLSHLPRIPKKPGAVTSRSESSEEVGNDKSESCPPQSEEGDTSTEAKGQEEEAADEDIFDSVDYLQDSLEVGSSGLLESDDEDDDADLMETPAALQKMLEASTRPIPETPVKNFKPEMMDIDDELPASRPLPEEEPVKMKYTFSLDKLLSDKEKQEAAEEKIKSLQCDVKDELYVQTVHDFKEDLSHDYSQDLLPEHKETLRKLRSRESCIHDFPPGLQVFDADRVGWLFSYPSQLSLHQFGFTELPGGSSIDKHLISMQNSNPEFLLDTLTGDIVIMCFDAISCPEAFLSWLFHLVSVVPYSLVAHAGHKILHHVLTGGTSKARQWTPSLLEITRIFLNFGAEMSVLYPCQEKLPFTHEELKLPETAVDINIGPQQPLPPTHRPENAQIIIQTLSAAFSARADQYTTEELLAVYIMLCQTSHDKHFGRGRLTHDIRVCLSKILAAFEDDVWESQMAALCEKLPAACSHHHNKVHLVEMVPYTERGVELRRRLAYAMLAEMLDINIKPSYIQDFSKHGLEYVISALQSVKVHPETDYYWLASLMSLFDLAVGNETLPASDKDALQALCDTLRPLEANVRDTIHDLDRTQVRDKMARMSSRWLLLMQTMGCRQLSIFNWVQGGGVAVETVQVQEEDTEGEEEEADDQDVVLLESEEDSDEERTNRQQQLAQDILDGKARLADLGLTDGASGED